MYLVLLYSVRVNINLVENFSHYSLKTYITIPGEHMSCAFAWYLWDAAFKKTLRKQVAVTSRGGSTRIFHKKKVAIFFNYCASTLGPRQWRQWCLTVPLTAPCSAFSFTLCAYEAHVANVTAETDDLDDVDDDDDNARRRRRQLFSQSVLKTLAKEVGFCWQSGIWQLELPWLWVNWGKRSQSRRDSWLPRTKQELRNLWANCTYGNSSYARRECKKHLRAVPQTGIAHKLRGREEWGDCWYIICGALEIGFVTLITINK